MAEIQLVPKIKRGCFLDYPEVISAATIAARQKALQASIRKWAGMGGQVVNFSQVPTISPSPVHSLSHADLLQRSVSMQQGDLPRHQSVPCMDHIHDRHCVYPSQSPNVMSQEGLQSLSLSCKRRVSHMSIETNGNYDDGHTTLTDASVRYPVLSTFSETSKHSQSNDVIPNEEHQCTNVRSPICRSVTKITEEQTLQSTCTSKKFRSRSQSKEPHSFDQIAEKLIVSNVFDGMKRLEVSNGVKPFDIVKQALESRGFPSCGSKPTLDLAEHFFVQCSHKYCIQAVEAIRSSDMSRLREIISNGTNLQYANKFGESLIHMACRRSHRDVVFLLIDEAGVSLRVRDDFGRTPLHDACWRAELDLKLLDVLLEREPKLLMLSDKRGHTPLDYVRRHHWAELIPFLRMRSEKFEPV